MKKLILTIVWSTLVLINPFSASAILNGTAVSEAAYKTSPVVAIYTVENKTAGRRCTGVLLNNTTILSAAHCFKDINNLQVYIVRSTFLDIPGRNPVQNEFEINNNQVSLHHDYNAEKHMNDLAIIKLNQELPDMGGVTYPKFTNSLNFERFIFFGYGRDLKQKTGVLNTVTKSKNKIMPIDPENENLIEFDQKDSVGINKGDSGGPVMATSDDGTKLLIAINGSVTEDGESGFVTKVSFALDWLRSFGVSIPLN